MSAALLRRFAETGEQAAFTEIVQCHGGWMRRAAERMTGNAAMAAEVTQEALALLAKKLPCCNSEGALTAWLHRTVVFIARNHLAKERRRRRALVRLAHEGGPAVVEGAEIPEAALRALDEVIGTLPPADRELILGRYMARQPWEALGAAAGRSADAVRKQAGRILEVLAAGLRGRGVVLPAAALGGFLREEAEAAAGGTGTAAVVAKAAVTGGQAAGKVPVFTQLSHALIVMNTSKIIAGTAAVCALLFSIPVAVLSLKWRDAEARATAGTAVTVVKRTAGGKGDGNSAGGGSGFHAPPGSQGVLTALGGALGGITAGANGPADQVNEPLVAAVQAVMSDPDRNRRVTGLSFLLQWMRTVDVPKVRAAMEAGQRPGVLYVNEGNALRERWAALAGKEAMLDYTEGKTDKAYNRLHSAIVRGWASTDPDGLKAWLDALPETCDWKDQAGGDILEGLLRGDPDRATQSVLGSERRTIEAALPRIADTIMQTKGLDGLEAWLKTVPATSGTERARGMVAYQLTEGRAFADAAAAAATLQSFAGEPWGGAALAGRLGERFGRASQERGFALLEQLPPDSPLAGALSHELFRSLAETQPNAAAAWLNENKESPRADQAAEALARAVQKSDPAGALAWAKTIREETRRAAVMGDLGRQGGER